MINRESGGFTLIELIVVIAIIIILSGVSLAAYFRFSQRQAMMNDARNFSTMLRRVQAMAKNLVYPSGCSGLSGYRVYSCLNCQNVSAEAVCSSGDVTVIDDEQVLAKAVFSEAISVVFTAGSGGVTPAGVFSISNSSDDYTVVVKMDENGNISTKGYESYP